MPMLYLSETRQLQNIPNLRTHNLTTHILGRKLAKAIVMRTKVTHKKYNMTTDSKVGAHHHTCTPYAALLTSTVFPLSLQVIAYITAAKRLSENELYEMTTMREPAAN